MCKSPTPRRRRRLLHLHPFGRAYSATALLARYWSQSTKQTPPIPFRASAGVDFDASLIRASRRIAIHIGGHPASASSWDGHGSSRRCIRTPAASGRRSRFAYLVSSSDACPPSCEKASACRGACRSDYPETRFAIEEPERTSPAGLLLRWTTTRSDELAPPETTAHAGEAALRATAAVSFRGGL
jgi:hypothetical protein